MQLKDNDKQDILQFIQKCNDTYVEYPSEKTLTKLFEEQVEKTPDNIAIIHEDLKITYKELNEKANSLARLLKEKKIKAQQIVGIMIEKSIEMIIAILAIQKAGAAYVPIDPDYPEERVKYMLNDCKVSLLLTEEKCVKRLEFFEGEILNIYDKNLYEKENTNLEDEYKSDNLSCVIYTSGSTGRPKGVLIENRGIVRQVKNVTFIKISEKDSMLQLANYVFVASVLDIYLPLLNGARVVLISKEDILNLEKLEQVIVNNNVSIAVFTTALFNLIVDNNIKCLNNIKTITIGGERLSVRHIKKALEYLGQGRLMQLYGQTESSLLVAYYPINNVSEDSTRIPIGKPVNNTSIYILRDDNELVSIGEVGELCVSGHGTARGYLNLDKLTKEKFTNNPFKDGAIMFRTGDLARYLPDGNIELIGRRDNQVKIRGFRVELEEIESQLLKLDYINEAAVIAKHNISGNDVLHAYVTAKEEIAVTSLKDELAKTLPDYMIPNNIKRIDEMPFTPTRKIDRKKLKDMSIDEANKEIVLPRNDIEQLIFDNLKKILPNRDISIYDDFESLGGTSIGAAKLISELSKKGIDITIEKIFIYKSIAKISEYIQSRGNKQLDLLDRMTSCLKYKENHKRNLILLPGAGGTNIFYLEVSQQINNIKGIYALMEPRIHGGDFDEFKDRDKLINKYIECIERIFEDGDYIGGHSFGGVLAFKICYELEKRGKKPGGLIILDSPVVVPKGGLDEDEMKKSTILLVFGKMLGEISDEEIERLEKLEYKEVEEYVSNLNFSKYSSEPLKEKTKVREHLEILMDNIRMLKTVNFIDGILSVPILVLRATERFDDDYENVGKWGQYTTGSCKIIDVPGSHYTMLKPPNYIKAAKIIDDFLEELR